MVSGGAFSRRERQIMDVLYRMKGASVADIRSGIPDQPSYSAVRVIVNVLERKGYLRHVKRGKRYIYSPKTPRRSAVQGAMKDLLSTYFENSLPKALSALVRICGRDLTPEDVARLSDEIRSMKKEDRT